MDRRYKDYLLSGKWKEKRALVITRSGGVCEYCKLRLAKDVHHLTYRRFKKERLTDLIHVCRSCHHTLDKERRKFVKIFNKDSLLKHWWALLRRKNEKTFSKETEVSYT